MRLVEKEQRKWKHCQKHRAPVSLSPDFFEMHQTSVPLISWKVSSKHVSQKSQECLSVNSLQAAGERGGNEVSSQAFTFHFSTQCARLSVTKWEWDPIQRPHPAALGEKGLSQTKHEGVRAGILRVISTVEKWAQAGGIDCVCVCKCAVVCVLVSWELSSLRRACKLKAAKQQTWLKSYKSLQHTPVNLTSAAPCCIHRQPPN